MSRQDGVSQWIESVSTHLPVLSRPQAQVLGLWSVGIVLAQSCGLSSVAAVLGALLTQPETTVRQRLREWYWEAGAKRGHRRRELAVDTCFGPLLGWILALWEPGDTRLALALDATTLDERFVVLSVSVLYRGCALPVAWTVRGAHQRGSWRPCWEAMLAQLAPAVPEDWTVLVLADAGLWARWLFRAIVTHGWHPYLRLDPTRRAVRPVGEEWFRTFRSLVPHPGTAWYGLVDCFRTRKAHLRCTLLAQRMPPYAHPWFILTDLAPEEAVADWYRLRSWIEGGFKDFKRGGWQWQRTRMSDPPRVARLWLALAVATLWAVSVGSAADAPQRPRHLSCVRRGLLTILVSLIHGSSLRLAPLSSPWPAGP